MMTRNAVAALVCCGLVSVVSAQAPTEKGRLGLALTEVMKPWTGDLDGMVERRMIRVLTTFSKTQYFVDRERRAARPTIKDDCSKTSSMPSSDPVTSRSTCSSCPSRATT